MASPLYLKRPVRVLIRTRRTDLENVHPSVEKADTELIAQFCQLSGIIDTAEIRHLITRFDIERVDILFDYGVPMDDHYPEVRAFKVRVKDSIPRITQLFNPAIETFVNRTVDVWKTELRGSNVNFPRRTDVEKIRRALASVATVSVIYKDNRLKC
ncbi:hypothetical protein K469DRAFT_346635 [Zopfia rhizophila CBS 207.26]|uniref:Uncharacterized protein n=1 Tax=Zopfia rhizophila CBS 207.26 TaxID=1314779 RepID=A0A6A6EQ46_9PEZI|nr:hypothetical protein K469DRAFT_346635 [Zopfia rhizophila CBS 207.26]